MWETFQFERSQASEFLLSKRNSIVPRLQQLIAAASAELEGLLEKALSGPFMDPSQEQRSTEHRLTALEHQFLNTLDNFNDLCHAYITFTGTDLHLILLHPGMDSPTGIRAGSCVFRDLKQASGITYLYWSKKYCRTKASLAVCPWCSQSGTESQQLSVIGLGLNVDSVYTHFKI